jgi:hypothetical protein
MPYIRKQIGVYFEVTVKPKEGDYVYEEEPEDSNQFKMVN